LNRAISDFERQDLPVGDKRTGQKIPYTPKYTFPNVDEELKQKQQVKDMLKQTISQLPQLQ
jgi:hypothetical protein